MGVGMGMGAGAGAGVGAGIGVGTGVGAGAGRAQPDTNVSKMRVNAISLFMTGIKERYQDTTIHSTPKEPIKSKL